MYGAFFISTFMVSAVVLVLMGRSMIKQDEEANGIATTKPTRKIKSVASKKQTKWVTLRGVQIVLGALWLLDGLLQLQHHMFTSNFATQVIAPAAQGQPAFVSDPMKLGMHMFLLHPAVFNTMTALTQLGIGVLILYKRTTKLGLLSSVMWGLVVWIFGEGYGGIFSGHTLLLMGAPGAVLIYVVLALAVLPRNEKKHHQHKPQQVAYWLALLWLVFWVGGSVYQLLPGQNTTNDVSSMIATNAQGAPSWLASLDTHTANFVKSFGTASAEPAAQSTSTMNMSSMQMMGMSMPTSTPTPSNLGYAFILSMAVIQFCIGIGVLFSGIVRKMAIGLGIVLSLIFWVVGQSLGGYYTGVATDPNAAPLFILLGLAILGCANLDTKLSGLGAKFTKLMVGSLAPAYQPETIEPEVEIADELPAS
jgi:hypothetical protein